jgi:hypothetical protein
MDDVVQEVFVSPVRSLKRHSDDITPEPDGSIEPVPIESRLAVAWLEWSRQNCEMNSRFAFGTELVKVPPSDRV